MARLAIVIVNWNRCEDLVRLLSDLRAQHRPADEIIVVDNSSSDGAPDTVERDFLDVRLIRLHKNMGLSFGRNVGIAAAKSDAIAILDNDLRVLDRTFLSKVCQSLESHPDCGVISFACLQGLWARPPADFRNHVYTLDELSDMASVGQSPVTPRSFYDWFFWGGACVVRRSVFKVVGLFDDIFGYGGEEWDFAYRCHAAGIRLLRDENLWLIHTHSPQVRYKAGPSLILKNMVIAQSRYMPLPDLLLFLVVQFAKSAKDAVVGGTVRAFVSTWWQVLTSWRTQIAQKRRPVSRQAMRRFYYLRTHQPESYADVERADTTALQFYSSRAKARQSGQVEKPVFAAMFD